MRDGEDGPGRLVLNHRGAERSLEVDDADRRASVEADAVGMAAAVAAPRCALITKPEVKLPMARQAV